jgi:hypothetical protein
MWLDVAQRSSAKSVQNGPFATGITYAKHVIINENIFLEKLN